MNTHGERRAPSATRKAFEAVVEVGAGDGPAFEAEAVNLSEEGMHLRTSHLPEAGEPLMFRFDVGEDRTVSAVGEVVWTRPEGQGGEFGIRFTNVSPKDAEELRRLSEASEKGDALPTEGARVRLHIEGLASPMRARVRDVHAGSLTVGSELSFLTVGRELELEDAEAGRKRLAKISSVDVEVDQTSHVPQLVVSLRYADGLHEEDAVDVALPEREVTPLTSVKETTSHDEVEEVRRTMGDVKGAAIRGFSAAVPVMRRWARQAKTAAGLLAHRGGGERHLRRTTAPAPSGGLHATGRRVVREDEGDRSEARSRFPLSKKKIAIFSGVGALAIVALAAVKKPGAPPATSGATPPALSDLGPASSGAVSLPLAAPKPLAPQPASQPAPLGTLAVGAPTDPLQSEPQKPTKPGKVIPFGSTSVTHGVVLPLKMDGPIEKIEGAAQPTGFTIRVPGRKSLEAASPLAARDPRVSAVKVSNDGTGAELSVTFKDGVPAYQVRAKGDTLEMVLAPQKGHEKALAKKEPLKKKHAEPGKAKKGSRHEPKGGERHEPKSGEKHL